MAPRLINKRDDRLGRSILVKALQDALDGDELARAWLSTPSQEFDYVCRLIGRSPTTVRRFAFETLAQPNVAFIVRQLADRIHASRIKPQKPFIPRQPPISGKQIVGTRPSTARWLTFNGETLRLTQWARRVGIHPMALSGRLKCRIPLEEALRPGSRRTRIPPSIDKHPAGGRSEFAEKAVGPAAQQRAT